MVYTYLFADAMAREVTEASLFVTAGPSHVLRLCTRCSECLHDPVSWNGIGHSDEDVEASMRVMVPATGRARRLDSSQLQHPRPPSIRRVRVLGR